MDTQTLIYVSGMIVFLIIQYWQEKMINLFCILSWFGVVLEILFYTSEGITFNRNKNINDKY